MILAMNMYPNVSGYLQAGDDVFFLLHNIANFPRDKVWFMPSYKIQIADFVKLKTCKNDICDVQLDWTWYADYQQPLMHIWKEFHDTSSPIVQACFQQLLALTKGDNRVFGSVQADFYYAPVNIRHKLLVIYKMFLRHELFLEMTVVNALACIVEDPNSWMNLSASWDFTTTRNTPRKHFEATTNKHGLQARTHLLDFYHPMKWGFAATNKHGWREFFCNFALPLLHSPPENALN
jgi:hypothetical protein